MWPPGMVTPGALGRPLLPAAKPPGAIALLPKAAGGPMSVPIDPDWTRASIAPPGTELEPAGENKPKLPASGPVAAGAGMLTGGVGAAAGGP